MLDMGIAANHAVSGRSATKEERIMFTEVARRIQIVLRDERGLETLEWIAMGVLIIVGVAAIAYPGGLLPAVTGAIGQVTAAL